MLGDLLLPILLISIVLLFLVYLFVSKRIIHKKYSLTRAWCNPLISPDETREWEAQGTFNPAVVKDDEGKIHLFYRAVGADGLSRIGYVTTANGTEYDERSSYPVHQLLMSTALNNSEIVMQYNPKIYPSGGGWGGSEDPRAVIIDDRVYITYVAFEGWHSVRIALTSIAVDDLKKEHWRWKKPMMISPEGEQHKNWALFPEKINGKFAIIHGISPNILVDYVESLDSLSTNPIKSRAPHDENRKYFGRKEFWDNSVRSIGPPPIKTEHGWLLLYHAMDKNDPNKYKLGAMVLDLNDPAKVLYRSPTPILEPEMHYENDWKPGVIYATGATVVGDDLQIFYGGGDKHVCMAHAKLSDLLQWLIKHGKE